MSTKRWQTIFSFPNPVNERAARVVASAVVLLAAGALFSQQPIVIAILATGFWLRVLSGPTLSPLGQLATRVIAPRLGPPLYCPGPPKRFAQFLGALFASVALLLAIIGWPVASNALLGVLLLLAAVESARGFCLGCWLFNKMIAAGWLPESICQSCLIVDQK
jgi:hypothetical protein